MNIILIIWFIICLFVPIFIVYQNVVQNKRVTWREFCFLVYGVFLAGIPFLYVVNH